MSMTQREVVAAAVKVLSSQKYDQCSDEYALATYSLRTAMSAVHHESLAQLVQQGPVHDGDVISKQARDDLMQWGLAQRACVRGEQGYTAANYRGWDVLKAMA